MHFDTLRAEIEGASNAQEVLALMREHAEGNKCERGSAETLYTPSTMIDWYVEEISKGRSEEASTTIKDALEGAGPGAVYRFVEGQGFVSVDKTGVAYAFGLDDDDLDLPAPLAFANDHVLYAPEGWRWVKDEYGYALQDDLGRSTATLDTEEGTIRVFRGQMAVATIETGPSTAISEAMKAAELEAIDELRLMPRDRGDGSGWGELLTYACNKASNRLFTSARKETRAADNAFDVPLQDVMASQYAFYYTDGTLTNPGFEEAYREAQGTLRLSDLVTAAARSHATADLDWATEHFQKRAVETLPELAMEMAEYEKSHNRPLAEQALNAIGPDKYGREAHTALGHDER